MASKPTARRTFLIGASACLAASAAGCGGPANYRELAFASFNDVQDELARLAHATALTPATTWSWAQTLAHCAQSIEFSMQGFPQPKSALFQRTLGATAFQVFAWRGRMSHDLREPIPGAPLLAADMPVAAALERLRAAMAAFQGFDGPLRPHFAYGELSKAEYEQAHAMHLANHFSVFFQKTT